MNVIWKWILPQHLIAQWCPITLQYAIDYYITSQTPEEDDDWQWLSKGTKEFIQSRKEIIIGWSTHYAQQIKKRQTQIQILHDGSIYIPAHIQPLSIFLQYAPLDCPMYWEDNHPEWLQSPELLQKNPDKHQITTKNISKFKIPIPTLISGEMHRSKSKIQMEIQLKLVDGFHVNGYIRENERGVHVLDDIERRMRMKMGKITSTPVSMDEDRIRIWIERENSIGEMYSIWEYTDIRETSILYRYSDVLPITSIWLCVQCKSSDYVTIEMTSSKISIWESIEPQWAETQWTDIEVTPPVFTNSTQDTITTIVEEPIIPPTNIPAKPLHTPSLPSKPFKMKGRFRKNTNDDDNNL